jgi:hypothetical protein
MSKKFKKGDVVNVNEPGHRSSGVVEGTSPSTRQKRGRALDGTLQWRYKVRTKCGPIFVDENYLSRK